MPSSSGRATILAKLSGSPISTQISSVTAPATKSGTSVSSTSVTRRKASQSSALMTSSARPAAHQACLGLPAVDQFGRQIVERDRAGLQGVLELLEHDLQRADESVLRLSARRLV